MKRLEDIDLSPLPWKVGKWYVVEDSKGMPLNQRFNPIEPIGNQCMLSASPEMYETLYTVNEILSDVLASEDLQANCHNGTVYKLSVAKKNIIDVLEKACGERKDET